LGSRRFHTFDGDVDPRMAFPVHFDDYDIFNSPLTDFQKWGSSGLELRARYLSHGETYNFQSAKAKSRCLDAVIDETLSQL
jgi:hypothetical protein